jgi:hypothetical protein
MTKEEVKKIIGIYYNSFLKPVYDFHGIILKPVKVGDDYIFWLLGNPKNLSYSIPLIREFVIEELMEFSKFIGIDNLFYDIRSKVCDIEEKKIQVNFNDKYINKTDYLKLKNSIKKINKIKFNEISCDIIIDDFTLGGFDEEYFVDYDVRFINVYSGNKLVRDLESSNKLVNDMLGDDDFLDYGYELFEPFNSIIFSNPTLWDAKYMYIVNSITPIDKQGNYIR